LVIAGIKGWLCGEVFKAVENSEFSKDVLFAGFIEEEDKPCLYNLAEIFVYPSFFEGFGLPPLEAMACGVPIIVSNKSSLPEVVGEAAIVVDPARIEELVSAIRNILEDRNLKERLINRGLERIKNFKWENGAKKFINLIKKYDNHLC
jgi:glycosyltransferase involved in cell wall biosynthesis